jgi:hypothetical protein
MINGRVLGPKNNISQISASGIWGLTEQHTAAKSKLWPSGIVKDSLVLWLDAANPASFTGSGSTWFDLSGSNNHMTLVGSPVYQPNDGGVVYFNGSNYAQNSLNYSTTNFTIMAASRYSGATRQRVVSSVSNNWLFGHWSNGAERYFAEGWIRDGPGVNDTNWRIFSGVENFTTDQRSFYVNNLLLVSNSSAGANGFNGLSLGRWGSGESSTCEVGFVLVYNRLLTLEEMTINYNFYKSRYGLL